MEIGAYLAFLVAAAVIIIVPGPTNLTIVSDSIEAGVHKSVWTVIGSALSHAMFITAATAGIGAILGRYPQVFVFIKWFGVMYLVFQGIRLIIRTHSQLRHRDSSPSGRGNLSYLIKGFVVNATNPKALLFYAALFPPFVNPHLAFVPQLITLASTFLALFVVVGVLHAVVAQKFARVLSDGRNANLTNKVSGSIMIGVAVWMATK